MPCSTVLCFVGWGATPPCVLLVFISHFIKRRASQTDPFTPLLAALLQWAQALLRSHKEKIEKGRRILGSGKCVALSFLGGEWTNALGDILRSLYGRRKQHSPLFIDWSRTVYRFFQKGPIESETFDKGLENLQQPGTFMKVPNMNHCSVDARRAFPVLLREPVGSERPEQAKGG